MPKSRSFIAVAVFSGAGVASSVCLSSPAWSQDFAPPEFTFVSELDGAVFQRYEAPAEPLEITMPPGFGKWQCTLDSLQREDDPDGRGHLVRGGFACSDDGFHTVSYALARCPVRPSREGPWEARRVEHASWLMHDTSGEHRFVVHASCHPVRAAR
jgi:hypothetical protein